MRVDLDERKIDFEMSEKTISAPIGRKKRGADAPAAAEKAAEPAKAGRRPAVEKKSSNDAYRPSDAAAKNAEVRKSREMKQALLAEAKAGGKPKADGRSGKAAPAKAEKPSKHRKGPPKAGGAARKPKAKS